MLGTVTFDPLSPEILKRYRHWLNAGARSAATAETKLLRGRYPASSAETVLKRIEEDMLEGACRVIGNDDLRYIFKNHRPFEVVGDDGETLIHLILDSIVAVAEKAQAVRNGRR